MKPIAIFTILIIAFLPLAAQKALLHYPFKYSTKTSITASLNKGAYVAATNNASNVAVVLHDITKADYLLFNANFKIISSFSLPARKTIFDYDASNLLSLTNVGSIGNDNSYIFFYVRTKKASFGAKHFDTYQVELIDFANKTVTQKDLIDIPKEERTVALFSEDNTFRLISANDGSSSLKIYSFSANGEMTTNAINFPVPDIGGEKKKNAFRISCKYVDN